MSDELKECREASNDYCVIDYRGHQIILDSQDAYLFYKYFYSVSLNGDKNQSYIRRNQRVSKNKWDTIPIHYDIFGKPPVGYVIDHINGNTRDNRRSNLRLATKSHNRINAKVQSDSSTGVSGVSYHKATGKYQAYIWVDKKRKYLGVFDTVELAIDARKSAEKEHYGEYVRME